MNDTTHPSPVIVERYAALALDEPSAVSVELHIERCAPCRAAVNAGVGDSAALGAARLDRNWLFIEAELDAPRPRPAEQVIRLFGVPVETARLMAATPALRRAWFIALAAALLFGLAAANPARGSGSTLLFLTLAPLVPVMGVALAYGPGVDPSYEMTLATPMSGFRLVLVRTITVLATSVALGGLATLVLQRRDAALAGAWLLPALGLSLVCLALTTFVRPRVAGALTGGTWVAVVLALSANASDELLAFRLPGQVVFAVLAVVGLVVAAARRQRFEVAAVLP